MARCSPRPRGAHICPRTVRLSDGVRLARYGCRRVAVRAIGASSGKVAPISIGRGGVVLTMAAGKPHKAPVRDIMRTRA
jgi:hypothetical protein